MNHPAEYINVAEVFYWYKNNHDTENIYHIYWTLVWFNVSSVNLIFNKTLFLYLDRIDQYTYCQNQTK